MMVCRELSIVQHFWLDKFPDEDGYIDSLWEMWESRIRKGHEGEEALISKAANRWESTLTKEQRELMPDDMFADDIWHTLQLTNAMYAAMIVSLWSCVECYLKDLLRVCKRAKHPNKKCSVHNWGIERIKKGFEKDVNVKLEKEPNYAVVNAVRVLSNSFKHSEGYYLPKEGKPHTQIDADLLTRWKCISDRFIKHMEIDYTKLPVKELVVTCGAFCRGLLSETKKNLEGLGHGI